MYIYVHTHTHTHVRGRMRSDVYYSKEDSFDILPSIYDWFSYSVVCVRREKGNTYFNQDWFWHATFNKSLILTSHLQYMIDSHILLCVYDEWGVIHTTIKIDSDMLLSIDHYFSHPIFNIWLIVIFDCVERWGAGVEYHFQEI